MSTATYRTPVRNPTIAEVSAERYCPYPDLLENVRVSIPYPKLRTALGTTRRTFNKHKEAIGLKGESGLATPAQIVLLSTLVVWCDYGERTGQTRPFGRPAFVEAFKNAMFLKDRGYEEWNVIRQRLTEVGVKPDYVLETILNECSTVAHLCDVECTPV